MPEEDQYEHNDGEKVCCSEELITEISRVQVSMPSQVLGNASCLPEWTKGCKSEPGLEDQGNDASPVKDESHLDLHYHVMVSNMENDEWESM